MARYSPITLTPFLCRFLNLPFAFVGIDQYHYLKACLESLSLASKKSLTSVYK